MRPSVVQSSLSSSTPKKRSYGGGKNSSTSVRPPDTSAPTFNGEYYLWSQQEERDKGNHEIAKSIVKLLKRLLTRCGRMLRECCWLISSNGGKVPSRATLTAINPPAISNSLARRGNPMVKTKLTIL